jgi:dihydroneopterin aldolase
MHAYTYEQFYEITMQLLTSNQYNVDEEIAKAIAEAVWDTSRNIRESIRIARISKSVEDVKWLATVFLSN